VRAFFHPGTIAHDPKFFLLRGRNVENEERPARVDKLLAGLALAGVAYEEPRAFGAGPRLAVHSLEYLQFLERAWDAWKALPNAGPEVVANIHPPRGPSAPAYPEGIVGRAGWHMSDTSCPIGPATWEAARLAADTAVAGAQALLDGTDIVYALCRPPGHHAYADRAGGHCFLNNNAIAAQYLRRGAERVAVLDIDVHHGNGTQNIFYERADVLTVSIHADPHGIYPWFLGHATERGSGAGAGFNLNMPLPLGTCDDLWLEAIDAGIRHVAGFAPDIVVIALGLDASATDPFQAFKVTREGFRAAGERMGRIPQPLLLVQEGGYQSDNLSANLAAFLTGVAENRQA
jgi:acetoin utilization deacetylase AcuC-like enzyme